MYATTTQITNIQPLSPHTHTLIFLHGREDSGPDLAESFFDSKSTSGKSLAELFPTMKFVFPTSAMRYSAHRDHDFSNSSFAEAFKGEEIISQWFDVWEISEPEVKKELMIPGLRESIKRVVEIVEKEARDVPMSRIILGGISQGCVAAFYTMLTAKLQLGGFIGLCSWLPFQKDIEEVYNKKKEVSVRDLRMVLQIEDHVEDKHNLRRRMDTLSICDQTSKNNNRNLPPINNTPIFLAHSIDDETVPISQFHDFKSTANNILNLNVTSKEYSAGGH